jgi:CDP-glucose 4,6-dehydratase
MKNNILVTGAYGFLGKHLVADLAFNQGLLAKNSHVYGLVRDTDRLDLHHPHLDTSPELWDFFTDIRCDMNDFASLRRIIADKEITHIYHLASKAIVRTCANDPVTAYETNVMGTLNLLEAVRQVGMTKIKGIVISTSDKAYGHTLPPYTASSPLTPKYTYECTKACQDILAQNYYYNYGLPISIVRASNIYGPYDSNHSRIIPSTCIKFRNGEKATVFSGTMGYKREFLYVDDVVDAFKEVMLNTEYKALDQFIFPLGGTTPVTVLDIVYELCDIAGVDRQQMISIVEKPPVFKEIESQYVEDDNMAKLGWAPKVSLKDGLKITYDSYA